MTTASFVEASSEGSWTACGSRSGFVAILVSFLSLSTRPVRYRRDLASIAHPIGVVRQERGPLSGPESGRRRSQSSIRNNVAVARETCQAVRGVIMAEISTHPLPHWGRATQPSPARLPHGYTGQTVRLPGQGEVRAGESSGSCGGRNTGGN